jgi:hypothetical protein
MQANVQETCIAEPGQPVSERREAFAHGLCGDA